MSHLRLVADNPKSQDQVFCENVQHMFKNILVDGTGKNLTEILLKEICDELSARFESDDRTRFRKLQMDLSGLQTLLDEGYDFIQLPNDMLKLSTDLNMTIKKTDFFKIAELHLGNLNGKLDPNEIQKTMPLLARQAAEAEKTDGAKPPACDLIELTQVNVKHLISSGRNGTDL